MATIIIVVLASVAALMWVGPWLVVLIGGKAFMVTLGVLAILIGWFGLWWYLIPLCLALVGATITTGWLQTRRL